MKLRTVFICWGVIVACSLAILHLSGYSILDLLIRAVSHMKHDPAGPLWLIGAFCVRAVLLVPASLLAVASGYCFGVGGGLTVAMLGGLAVGMIGYGLGRMSGKLPEGRLSVYSDHLKASGLRYTMYMRWMMLPYDPCSILCGNAGVRLRSFLGGTILGNLPGTTSCVLFGAGIKGEFTGQMPSFDWRLQGGALVLLVFTIVLSRVVARKAA